MTRIVNAKDGAAAPLGLEEGEVAQDDAIVDAFANRKGWRDLLVDLNLVATRRAEVAEVCLPQGAPARFHAAQLVLIEQRGSGIQQQFPLQQVVGSRESRGESSSSTRCIAWKSQ